MARLTRHELKQDELRSTFEEFEQFVKQRYKEIVTVVSLLAVVGGLAGGLKLYQDHQQAEANAQLGLALKAFRAYVGPAEAGTLGPDAAIFPTAREKYKKALEEFSKLTEVRGFRKLLPEPKAVTIARYQIGVCRAALGDQAGAMRALEEASRASDPSVASLAKFALAGEMTKNGKLQEAAKLYQDLADHPTLTVPKATALMAKAEAYRATQPAQARQIYERMEKELGPDAMLAQVLKQQMASLPK